MNREVVTVSDISDLRGRLERFAEQFTDCFMRRPTHEHFQTYMAGQASTLERKSIEPMALHAGVPPRTLQEFLGLSRWDHAKMRARIRERVLARHPGVAPIALIDETSFPKKGDKTACVQRQYCGATGKTDNCVVTVNLGYAVPDFHALIDCELYLPEQTWAEDAQRRKAAGIPEDLKFRTKGQIALELLRRAQENSAGFKYLTADEAYGSSSQFRAGVAELGMIYVVEVSRTAYGWTRQPCFEDAHAGHRTGRPRKKPRLTEGARTHRRIDELWKRGGPSWRGYHIKDTEKGPVVWDVRATRFWPAHEGTCLEECWLLIARHALTGELKYFLSNASASTPVETLLHVAFTRAEIEQLFAAAKSEIGLDHFEVRQYLPLVRHLIVSLASLLFLQEETSRLRKKLLVERVSGQTRNRGAA
ncbi:MAG: IS701 family transposase [Acidobacteriaceae bacterium]|nr:IS701 family transposase [Acidobacteriaceae bacterium]